MTIFMGGCLHGKNETEEWKMLSCEYFVESIDGDYAKLRRCDMPGEEPKLVARALLPAQIEEGMRLKYEMLQYSII